MILDVSVVTILCSLVFTRVHYKCSFKLKFCKQNIRRRIALALRINSEIKILQVQVYPDLMIRTQIE